MANSGTLAVSTRSSPEAGPIAVRHQVDQEPIEHAQCAGQGDEG